MIRRPSSAPPRPSSTEAGAPSRSDGSAADGGADSALHAVPDRDQHRRADRALQISLLEGALHAVMVGVVESYLGAFAVELGHARERLALLATLPLLAGACCQLLSPKLCSWLGSRKRMCVVGALWQTASLALLIAIALTGSTSLWLLLLAKVAFWTSAGSIAPAWNAWMASLTVHTERSRYFALRSALTHLVLLIAFAAAGFALERAGVQVLDCYVVLFGVGFAARLASAIALGIQLDVEAPAWRTTSRAPIVPRLRHALASGRFRVAMYLALLALGTQVSAPFFTPYMLRELGLDYGQFALLATLSISSKAVAFPFCHRLAKRIGLSRLLAWAGAGVALIPVVWALSTRFDALVFAHVLGGTAWAALEYTSFQLLLDAAPEDHTSEFFALSNAVTGVAQVAGAVGGGFLLGRLSLDYSHVFLVSALLRALPLTLLFVTFRLEGYPPRLRALYTRFVSVRPAAGADQRPILAGKDGPLSPSTGEAAPEPASSVQPGPEPDPGGLTDRRR